MIDQICNYSPNFRDLIAHMEVRTPYEIENEIGLTEGNIFHGELSLEQLAFMRPAAGWARYKTPIKDYWLASSSAHPGGGIMAAPGRLAALEILKSS